MESEGAKPNAVSSGKSPAGERPSPSTFVGPASDGALASRSKPTPHARPVRPTTIGTALPSSCHAALEPTLVNRLSSPVVESHPVAVTAPGWVAEASRPGRSTGVGATEETAVVRHATASATRMGNPLRLVVRWLLSMFNVTDLDPIGIMMRIIGRGQALASFVVVLAIHAVLVRPAVAQATTSGTTVSGVVYDSVGRVPLANADVELAEVGAQRTIARRARSDSLGRFEMSDVAPGRYFIGFYHPLLDSLSLELPTRTLEVTGTPVRVSLGVPSLATIASVLCPTTYKSDSTATVIGRVYDAASLGGVASGTVRIWWREVVVANAGGLQQRQPRTNATTADDGGFAFCAVPANIEFGLIAVREGDSTDVVALTVTPGGVMRRDLFVGHAPSRDTTVRPTVFRGRVHTSDGRPLANASVDIARSGNVARTDDAGRFEMSLAPVGTQRVDVRHIGYAATSRVVDFVAGRAQFADVTLVSVKQLMDTVRIVAERVYDVDSNGFQKRRKTGLGHYFGPEDVERLHVVHTSDLLYRVPAVRIRGEGLDRIVVMRNFFINGECVPTVFIDGVRLSEMDVTDIDAWVPPEDLAGLE